LLSLGDFRGPAGSFSVTRDDLVFEGEFELFMRLSGTYGVWLILDHIVLNAAGEHEMMQLTIASQNRRPGWLSGGAFRADGGLGRHQGLGQVAPRLTQGNQGVYAGHGPREQKPLRLRTAELQQHI